ncbi:transcriptional regulator [Aestuariicoccus sp. MJ-SS9]|uniref:transcriptional regulator n=1 Tax=Aestuariicoccus sp. MJ-SS9 TaxID=3079855 RepID=UPI0029106B78|nr:transcriptional regulator [Aestuariicoccus sp. MJ-SS9]MDU8912429.1 transcriptional regulator [Aestuariicoccus sp. MJ-SS9]
MKKDEGHLRITLVGPLQVTAADGANLTPVGAKNQGLLALLVLSPGMSRPRRWLEDKLWSTFAPEQASANLRQALSKLRTMLGAHSGCILADRTTISLVPAQLDVDVLSADLKIEGSRDLLEGLDVRDPEFEDWLREERARLQTRLDAARPSQPKGLLMRCRTQVHTGGMASLIGDVLTDRIGENIAEQVRAWRQAGLPLDAGDNDRGDLEICCDLVENEGSSFVYIKIVHLPSARVLHSMQESLDSPAEVLTPSVRVASIVFEAADRALSKLPLAVETTRPEARATALSRLAMYRMFSFEPEALREADSLLSQAHDIDGNGIYTAWRCLIRNIQMIELLEKDIDAVSDELHEMNHKALEQGADNALVQALIGQVRVMALGDAAGAMDLAKQSVERNPSGGFGWLSLAVATNLAGEHDKALEHSDRARQIARHSPFRHWWDLYHCIVAVACNRPGIAIEAGEAAARAAPAFRPAHRHLLALYALDRQYDKAKATADKLAKIEPGFSIDRILHDDSYPVRTLRNKGLLEPIRGLL